MKKYKFYFKKENGEIFGEYINAISYEIAVNVACEKEEKEAVELDINRTVMAFFTEQ